MTLSLTRSYDRSFNQIRPISVEYGIFEYADGSVLFCQGKTKILCAVSLQNSVPQFLRGKNKSWLTAEYSLLPMSTEVRSQRESSQMRKNGRSVEISRFISRSLRTIVNLNMLGERTVYVDCDVLQADGGTRVASITAAGLALRMAEKKWLTSGIVDQSFLLDDIAAISVGAVDGQALLDIDYKEDSCATADFNFVVTKSGKVIEMQGGAEKEPLSWDLFEQMKIFALKGADDIFASTRTSEYDEQMGSIMPAKIEKQNKQKIPFFSIKNRLQQ